jgi:2-polyprenyl-3-methyl-5-hydroxy-6-metoxy-1,4-benzoquinol methylase
MLAAVGSPIADSMAFLLLPSLKHTFKPFSSSFHVRTCVLKRFHAHSGRQVRHSAVSIEQDATATVVVSCMEQVHQLVQRNDTVPVLVDGTITAIRLFGPSFGFIDVHVNEADVVVQLMFKRQEYHGDMGGLLEGLNLGMPIRVVGVASTTRNPGEGVVLVRFCEIRGLPPNPQHVRKLLRLISQDKLHVDQLESAANMTSEELKECIHVASKGVGDFTALAKKLLSWSSTKQSSVTRVASDSNGDRSFPPVPQQLLKPPSLVHDYMDSPDEMVMIDSISELYRQGDQELEGNRPIASLVRLQHAWVQNRRRFRDSVTVVKVSDAFMATPIDGEVDLSSNQTTRCSCILHPDVLRADEASNVYANLLCAGSRVMLKGYVEHEKGTDTPILWVTNVQLLRCSWRPMVIRYLMELLVRNEFDMEEAADALDIDLLQAAELSQLDLTERQWKANEISRKLQNSQTRMANVSEEMMRVLESFEGLRMAFPKQVQDEYATSESLNNADYQGDNLLATNSEGTWWERKKRPQLEFMGRQVQSVVHSHPEFGKRKLRILDVGGGKGVLAHYLAQLLGDTVQVQVIDIARGAIKNGMMRSKRLALASPVEFFVGDASQFENGAMVDVVVALHACGSLSDVALGHAVNHGAGFVICPCCFRSNPHLRVPVQHDGSIRQFQSPHEWLYVDTNDLDTIKRISEVQGDERLASEGQHALCAIRAEAVQRRSEESYKDDLEVKIKTFSASYSTRNFCLVGKVRRRGA